MKVGQNLARQAANLGKYSDLTGKSVFITGGGSGIGAAVTESFVEQGAKVAFVQRSDASTFCDGIEARYGARPHFIACDITDITALQNTICQVQLRHGPIDILVNNAANDQRQKTWMRHFGIDRWRSISRHISLPRRLRSLR